MSSVTPLRRCVNTASTEARIGKPASIPPTKGPKSCAVAASVASRPAVTAIRTASSGPGANRAELGRAGAGEVVDAGVAEGMARCTLQSATQAPITAAVSATPPLSSSTTPAASAALAQPARTLAPHPARVATCA